jgi:hypothetical protein
MPVKSTIQKFLVIILVFGNHLLFSQAKSTSAAAGKGSAKGTLASDMDCTVKINGAAKPVILKAFTAQDVMLKAGDNAIEALSADKKSTYKKTVNAKAGEKIFIEISFFDDGKFLDYVKNGNVSMVEAALKKDPTLLNNDNDLLTSSPLEMAISSSQVELVKYLISKGASFSKPENINPLHKTILYVTSVKPAKDKPAPDRELAEYFLSKGVKINDKDDGGNTPLLCAVRANKLDMVMFLVEKGADVNMKNDFDDTPLKLAQDKGAISIMNYLKTKGALEK